jgi:hypothetical protein
LTGLAVKSLTSKLDVKLEWGSSVFSEKPAGLESLAPTRRWKQYIGRTKIIAILRKENIKINGSPNSNETRLY